MHVGRGKLGAVFVDVLYPFVMVGQVVGGDTNDFDVALRKVWAATSDFAELGGANRGEVARMREENAPGVTEPLMEPYLPGSGLCLEVGCNAAETKAWWFSHGICAYRG